MVAVASKIRNFGFLTTSILFALACLAPSSLWAQSEGASPKKKQPARSSAPQPAKQLTWEKEPDSFMGFKFGQPLTTQIDECPKRESGSTILGQVYDMHPILSKKLRCFRKESGMRDGDHYYIVDTLPDIGMWTSKAFIKVATDNFEGMRFDIRHLEWLKMRELLTARYGEPTRVGVQKVQTRGGMSLEGRVLTWTGRNVTIELSEYGSKIDEASVDVSTGAYLEFLDRKQRQGADKFKDKL